MNFKTEFKKGQEGRNKGLSMGEGLENMCQALNGIQRGMSYGIAAAPKVGKSQLVDAGLYLVHMNSG
jgi:replicative DNA helicase